MADMNAVGNSGTLVRHNSASSLGYDTRHHSTRTREVYDEDPSQAESGRNHTVVKRFYREVDESVSLREQNRVLMVSNEQMRVMNQNLMAHMASMEQRGQEVVRMAAEAQKEHIAELQSMRKMAEETRRKQDELQVIQQLAEQYKGEVAKLQVSRIGHLLDHI